MADLDASQAKPRRRSYWGCLGMSLLWAVMLVVVAVGVGYLSLLLAPPFGYETTARVLILGLDEADRLGGDQRRADTILLCAARLDGAGTLLLSVPRDAWVRIPNHSRQHKINAAYALGKEALVKQVLAKPSTLNAELPYHLIIDSSTVRAVIDALGGIRVSVPFAMNYDDNWGNLHIHLNPGLQLLTGEQAVGYLRWRKNSRGRSEDDFSRAERQRAVLIAIGTRMRSWQGITRTPAVYHAFRQHSQSNLTDRQLFVLGWASREIRSEAVPATPRRLHGTSYVFCNWAYGRALWEEAVR
jgi:LCP family protein required for cell wall assembly